MKDPYLKPVIYSGLLSAFLSILIPPVIFIFCIIGGFYSIKLSQKILEKTINFIDSTLISLFSGIFAGLLLDIVTILSLSSEDNKRLVLKVLKQKWPKDMPTPNFTEILPSLYFTTSILIIIIASTFSILGGIIAYFYFKKKNLNK